MSKLSNFGHGHVFPRPDGVRAGCGGPMMCSECAKDFAQKVLTEKAQQETTAPLQKESGT